MARRKRKSGSIGKYIILIGSIILLNLVGISYGHWNDGLQIITSVSTGKLDIIFDEDKPVTIEMPENLREDGGELDAKIQSNSIVIQGKIPHDYIGTTIQLNYSVKNEGTIPAKMKIGEEIIPVVDRKDSTIEVILGSDLYQSIDVRQFNE